MADGIRGLHAYWRVPGGLPRPLRQLSCATWLLSILSWQRLAGPIDLYADEPTMDWLGEVGWLGYYDRVALLDSSTLDDRFDRAACFALPKLLALDRYPDAMLVDPDAFLLDPLELPAEGSAFAHLERGDVDFYAGLHQLNNPAGVELPDSLPMVGNTSLFHAATPDLARRISAAGLAFLAGNPATPGRDIHLHMTVAEQVLATHLTTRSGYPIVNLFDSVWTLRTKTWLTTPPHYGHLWSIKREPRADFLVVMYATVVQILRDRYQVDPHHVRAVLERL